MSKIETLFDGQDGIDDYDYQFQVYRAAQLKRMMTPNEYEVRQLQEQQINDYNGNTK